MVCALLLLTTAWSVAAQDVDPAGGCSLTGSWIGEADIGAQFFAKYSRGDSAHEGPLTIEWIVVDPTLFGNFPSAVFATQGAGAWRMHSAVRYTYTWIAYGLDATGLPVYAIKMSGQGEIHGCDTTLFDWVMEIFPVPLDPLRDDPVTCLSGVGVKDRISVTLAVCE
jgi:hypothetical protein